MHAGVCYWALIVKLGEESIRERVREEVGSWVVVGGCCCSAADLKLRPLPSRDHSYAQCAQGVSRRHPLC